MTLAGVSEPVEQFVFRLLGTGATLASLVNSLADELPAERYPGEEPIAVVLEMVCGTIATALEPLDRRELVRATELMELAHGRVIEHLKLAHALGRRVRGEDGGAGRTDG